ncbi:sigma-70 family RNA polymerase sigma factor [Anaerotignum lactatifermentans]|uniref:Sigma-70 family RNA polymerase sigma factor n=1 Tax=Anaerotignum lactatifermentans TaxID=160404 RepID=A0ABS2G9K5_9FIRM|nr:sigma-70 family RNA polymerase sigma factor [Anaerotignum lactatifermentans]MBM6829139.1 sigma-70 family RNA polymerase sigma factor [Anaerotignum lactatifermentans]MBM6877253.1 sigma-70 family RNA polymerase sigma factor [Anaerotignum lactatifermentans]MBM6950626.1 sigma-70 family RNA polymerase sigma factor [Anaerotignum lactatifermentans]
MEHDVLKELYERYYQAAYLYVLSLCRKKEWAEDIVNEGFLKACLTLEKENEGFLWWLMRVCRNLWLDQLKKQKRQDGAEIAEIPVAEDALAGILQKEENIRLYAAMNALPPKDRELLIWHYFGGLPIRQMASLRGCSETAVKTALFRARRRLKQKLGGERE